MKRHHRLGAAAAVLLLPAAASASPPGPGGQPAQLKGEFEVFPSGLRLVVYEQPGAAESMFATSYRVGASDDPAGKEGVAYLAERLAARAGNALRSRGVRLDGSSGRDHTDFWEIGRPGELDPLIALEAERMKDPLAGVDAKEFLAEREAAMAALRDGIERDPANTQIGWLLEAAFPGHPYGRPVLGTAESLGRIGLEDVRAFVREHYTPQRAVLVLWSPRPAREAARAVAARFGALAVPASVVRSAPVVRVPPSFPSDPPEDGPLPVRRAAVAGPRLWVGWAVPGDCSGSTPLAFAASRALGELLHLRFSRPDAQAMVRSHEVRLETLDGLSVILASFDLRREEDAPSVLETVKDGLVDLLAAPERSIPFTAVAGERDNSPAHEWSSGSWAFTPKERPYTLETLASENEHARSEMRFLASLGAASRALLAARHALEVERLHAPAFAQFLRTTGEPDFVAGYPRAVAASLSGSLDAYAARYLTRRRALAMLIAPDRDAAQALAPTRPGPPK